MDYSFYRPPSTVQILLFKRSIYREARFFSLKNLKGLLEGTGFKDLKWASYLYFPPIDSSWFLKWYRPFEVIGRSIFPKEGAFLVIVGRK